MILPEIVVSIPLVIFCACANDVRPDTYNIESLSLTAIPFADSFSNPLSD